MRLKKVAVLTIMLLSLVLSSLTALSIKLEKDVALGDITGVPDQITVIIYQILPDWEFQEISRQVFENNEWSCDFNFSNFKYGNFKEQVVRFKMLYTNTEKMTADMDLRALMQINGHNVGPAEEISKDAFLRIKANGKVSSLELETDETIRIFKPLYAGGKSVTISQEEVNIDVASAGGGGYGRSHNHQSAGTIKLQTIVKSGGQPGETTTTTTLTAAEIDTPKIKAGKVESRQIIVDNLQSTDGKVSISAVMNLTPQETPPEGKLGDIYVSTDSNLYFHNGTSWKKIVLE